MAEVQKRITRVQTPVNVDDEPVGDVLDPN